MVRIGTHKDVVQAAGWELEPRGGSLGGAQRAWLGRGKNSVDMASQEHDQVP